MAHNHENILLQVREELPSDALISDLADLFKVFGDTTRMKILFSLFEAELCVCAIADLLCMEQSAISHQLRALRQMKLIKSRRQGRAVYYSLADGHVVSILACATDHIREN